MPDLSFVTPSYMAATEAHKPDMVEMIIWYELERKVMPAKIIYVSHPASSTLLLALLSHPRSLKQYRT